VVTSTLDAIADEVERAGIQPPATLVVGDVVSLRDKLVGRVTPMVRVQR
jgi:siroheme synthase